MPLLPFIYIIFIFKNSVLQCFNVVYAIINYVFLLFPFWYSIVSWCYFLLLNWRSSSLHVCAQYVSYHPFM